MIQSGILMYFSPIALTDFLAISVKYMRTLVADGNFKQDHLRSKNPQDDVALSDGQGYMVGKENFDLYISSAPLLPKLVTDLSLS